MQHSSANMTDKDATSSSSLVATEKHKVYVHFMPDAPTRSHTVRVDSYTINISEFVSVMRAHAPPGGWRVDFDAPDFALCHVAAPEDEDDEEAVEAAVRAAFTTKAPKATFPKPLTAFQVTRNTPPRFVVVGSEAKFVRGSLYLDIEEPLQSLVSADAVSFDSKKWAFLVSTNVQPRAINPVAGLEFANGKVNYADDLDPSQDYTTDHSNHLSPSTPPEIITLDSSLLPVLDSRVLFVRTLYKQIFEGRQFLRGLKKIYARGALLPRKRCFVLVGPPGIGKSSVGMYLFWRAARMGRAVLYRYHKWDTGICGVYDGKVTVLEFDDFNPLIDRIKARDDLLTIYDGVDADAVPPHGFSVFIDSANSSLRRYNEIRKVATTLYMPVFTWAEVAALGTALGLRAKLGDYEATYMKCGGVPRTIFDQPYQVDLDVAALKKLDDDMLCKLAKPMDVHIVGRPAAGDGFREIPFHNAVSPDLRRAFTVIATDHYADIAMRRLHANQRLAQDNFDRLMANSPLESSEFGQFFVRAVQRRLLAGGKFAARRWSYAFEISEIKAKKGKAVALTPTYTPVDCSVKLPASVATRRFTRFEHIKLGEHYRWHSARQNFPAIDCVEVNGALGNMSVGKLHHIMILGGRTDSASPDGIATVARHLWTDDTELWPSKIKLYFFMPHYLASAFVPGEIWTIKGDAFADVVLSRLAIYTVAVPFAEEITKEVGGIPATSGRKRGRGELT